MIHTKTNTGFRFETSFQIRKPLSEVFPFFAEAKNLEKITPQFLNFKITSEPPLEMREDLEISYQLKLYWLPLKWTSLISKWEPPHCFVDQQLVGPYRYWIHKHQFEELSGTTRITDIVNYSVYGGKLINALFVKNDIEKIFSFRKEKVKRIFAN